MARVIFENNLFIYKYKRVGSMHLMTPRTKNRGGFLGYKVGRLHSLYIGQVGL